MADDSESLVAAQAYCLDQVRRLDRDRFLTALFAPAARRPGLFALYAFNLELARAREAVTQPIIGQMRLQWWRDAVEGMVAGTPRRHAVALALTEAIHAQRLDRALLDRLIDAREADMADEPPADMAALLAYAEGTSAPLVHLALQVLGADTTPAREAGRHVGIAWALTGLLRAVPFHARRHRLNLPLDRLTAAGGTPHTVFALQPHPAIAAVAAEIGAAAHTELVAARRYRGAVPRAAVPALLPATLADSHLGRLEKAGWDPFAPGATESSPGAVWRLATARALGRW